MYDDFKRTWEKISEKIINYGILSYVCKVQYEIHESCLFPKKCIILNCAFVWSKYIFDLLQYNL